MGFLRITVHSAAGALLLSATAAALADPAAGKLSGDYVEARSCNVYTGACHMNGEAVTIGREALMAWNVRSGSVSGVRLDGAKALAVVSSAENLGDDGARRKTVLYVDENATDAQKKALLGTITQRCRKALGEIVAVKSAPIEFKEDGLDYTVRIPGVAYLKTTRFACDHCVMPHQLWYEPLVSLKSSIVARAAVNEFKGTAELPASWKRVDENSSFVGEFTF